MGEPTFEKLAALVSPLKGKELLGRPGEFLESV